MKDNIDPQHYKKQPIECIEFTEHMSFLLGNAFKYVWRYKDKNSKEDLKKAEWYLNKAIEQKSTEVKNIPMAFKNLDKCKFKIYQYQALRNILLAEENKNLYGKRETCLQNALRMVHILMGEVWRQSN